jgi:dihydropteroate synthase
MNKSAEAERFSSSFILHPSSFRRPAVMGILNITPDSFSDGGVHLDHSAALHAAMQMEEDGAAMLDVGGESTRPGADPVSVDEELARVIPVIEQIRRRSAIPISIDTMKSAVARAAIDAGATAINDVTAMRHDPAMRALAAERDVDVILMHMRGEPRTMQTNIHYDEVVTDVARELADFRDAAIAAGIARARIFVDPGIGFGKTFEHNLALLARAKELRDIAPLVIGASRKAFIGHLTGRASGPERRFGSLAAISAAARAGAAMVRVHDVGETVDFLKVWAAIEEHRAG